MQIQLEPASGVPIYLQLVRQIRYLVAAGRLAPGDELPPIRALAERLVINPNTVARAYRELEHAGVLLKDSTKGTFVADNGAAVPVKRLEGLAARVDALLDEAEALNVGADELVELLRERQRVRREGGDS